MTRILVTALVGAALSGVIGYFLIPVLRTIKAGQSIREVGPTWHNYKAGTPGSDLPAVQYPFYDGLFRVLCAGDVTGIRCHRLH